MSAKYKKELQNLGIKTLKPMQETAIKAMLSEREITLLSPTGSGKTLAFLLPLLSLINKNVAEVQVIILLPTRELALQIEEVFKKLQTGHKVTTCYGGHSMSIEKNNLKEAPKVIIGTPGRIDDHMNRNNFSWKAINTIIVDEFDKCLELGFNKEMKRIFKRLRLSKTVLTSATDLLDIPEFTGITKPIKLDYLDKNQDFNKNLSLLAVHSNDRDKLDALGNLLKEIAFEPTIVFCNRKDAIDRISDYLIDNDFTITTFHGNLEQDERERSIIKFKNGSAHILLCTDLAARGIDLDNIKNIVHYHLPHQLSIFTHRNGRTARMQKSGKAFLIFAPEENLSFEHDLEIENYFFTNETKYKEPEYRTLYISKGKKDKINKIDIVGFFYKQIELDRGELGIIDVKDFCVYVGIKASAIKKVMGRFNKQKIKGKTVKIELAR